MIHKVNFSYLGYSNLINIEQFVYKLFSALQQESNGIHNELERIECLYQIYHYAMDSEYHVSEMYNIHLPWCFFPLFCNRHS